MLMLALLLPPLGLAAVMSAPQVSWRCRASIAVAILMAAGVLGALEEEFGLAGRLWLDARATIYFDRGQSRFSRNEQAARIDAYRTAYALEPPPGEPNLLGRRPDCSDAAFRLGRELIEAGRLGEARVALAAASFPRDGDNFSIIQLVLAGVEQKLGRNSRAAERMNAVLDQRKIDPEHPELILLRARLLTAENPGEARKALMELVWKRRLGYLSDAYSALADLERAQGHRGPALVDRLLALRNAPQKPELLTAALEAAREAGQPEVPVRAFATALSLQSRLKGGEEAVRVFGRIGERYPDFPVAAACQLHIGGHYERKELDLHQAADCYRKAASLARQPQLEVEARFKLARVLGRLGLLKGAHDAYRKVLELAPPGSFHASMSRRGDAQLSRSRETREQMQRLERWIDELVPEDDSE
jgi:tetratricopeptide (TPR) repeat protein